MLSWVVDSYSRNIEVFHNPSRPDKDKLWVVIVISNDNNCAIELCSGFP